MGIRIFIQKHLSLITPGVTELGHVPLIRYHQPPKTIIEAGYLYYFIKKKPLFSKRPFFYKVYININNSDFELCFLLTSVSVCGIGNNLL